MSPLKREECHMRVRLLRRSDLSIATELVRQLGYDVQPSDMAEHIDLVLANDTHYAAVADNGDTILGLVHVTKGQLWKRALQFGAIPRGRSPSAEIWNREAADGGRRDLGSL
jgi:hypothetical protein